MALVGPPPPPAPSSHSGTCWLGKEPWRGAGSSGSTPSGRPLSWGEARLLRAHQGLSLWISGAAGGLPAQQGACGDLGERMRGRVRCRVDFQTVRRPGVLPKAGRGRRRRLGNQGGGAHALTPRLSGGSELPCPSPGLLAYLPPVGPSRTPGPPAQTVTAGPRGAWVWP